MFLLHPRRNSYTNNAIHQFTVMMYTLALLRQQITGVEGLNQHLLHNLCISCPPSCLYVELMKNEFTVWSSCCHMIWNIVLSSVSWMRFHIFIQFTGISPRPLSLSMRWSSAVLVWTTWCGGWCRRVRWRRSSRAGLTSCTTDTSFLIDTCSFQK